jgi:transcription elongation factor
MKATSGKAIECWKEFYKPLGKSFIMWKDLMFRNGMIYLPMSVNKLTSENICPMLDEVKRFQGEAFVAEDGAYESDLDEWDLLPDSTMIKTVRNDTALRVQTGDRCRVSEGQFQNCEGHITSIEENGLAVLLTNDKIPVPIKVPAAQLDKVFNVGESIRVLQGIHSGEPGLIMSLDDKFASVLMEASRSELKVPIGNMRRREQLEAKHGMSHFLVNGRSSSNLNDKTGQTGREVYSAGDLVILDGH